MPKKSRKAAKQHASSASARKGGGRLHLHGEEGSPRRVYDAGFKVTRDYLDSLPDIVESGGHIEGARVPVQQVGISNFKMPLKYRTQAEGLLTLETSVSGSVSLGAEIKGINMSRIMRSFYEYEDRAFSTELLGRILEKYRKELRSGSAWLGLLCSYPIRQRSLRSGLSGYHYYRTAFRAAMDERGMLRRWMEFDFVYSSTCPCSAELAEHARVERGLYAVPHSQRSKARIRVELAEGAKLRVEDLYRHCLNALKTETQVMVKREDEQAFAEMNGAYLKLVEDAARLLYQELNADKRIKDFQVACAHLESLHSHDAVSVICKGLRGGYGASVADFDAFFGE